MIDFYSQSKLIVLSAIAILSNLVITQKSVGVGDGSGFESQTNARIELANQSNSNGEFGTIGGKLVYPSEYIPAQKICAEELHNKQSYCIESQQDQNSYTMQLPPGVYFIFAVPCSESYSTSTTCRDGYLDWKAYYTENSVCGFTHQCGQILGGNRIPVKVEPGDNISDITFDWWNR